MPLRPSVPVGGVLIQPGVSQAVVPAGHVGRGGRLERQAPAPGEGVVAAGAGPEGQVRLIKAGLLDEVQDVVTGRQLVAERVAGLLVDVSEA